MRTLSSSAAGFGSVAPSASLIGAKGRATTNSAARRHRSGLAAIYIGAAIMVLVGFTSFAVDYGRVQLAKGELRRATDAAAHAGAEVLGTWTTSRDAAATFASSNLVDGTGLVLDTSGGAGVTDILFGTWDDVGRTFTTLTGSNQNYANAIQINTKRDVNLFFARVLGVSSCRIHASATACQVPAVYGVVGLNYVNMSGNSSDSYWSTNGSSAGNSGNIASNGNITVSGNSSIHGNAHPGIGKSVIGASNVYGSTTPLTTTLSYPNGSASPYTASNNDNALLPPTIVNQSVSTSIDAKNKTASIPAGNYFLQDFSQTASGNLTLLGPVTFYVYGTVSLAGQATAASNLPKNLTIIMVPNPTTGAAPGSITIGSGSALYATIYAPQSALTMSGNGSFYGSIVAKSIDMTGTSSIHYDVALSGSKSTIALVK